MNNKVIFDKFLEKNEILIVDKNPSSRNRLLKIICDLGVKRNMLHLKGSILESQEILQNRPIGVVISEYFIGGGSGFDLFKLTRERNPDKKELCLILVTSDVSQTSVAKAAEEDVDSFIIKPYSIQSIQENLINCISKKVYPTDYMLLIEKAKQLISDEKFQDAIEILKTATKMNSKPSLAYFYMGHAEYLRNEFEGANNSYHKGLNINNIHYKCLVGLYELFMREEKFKEAYEVVKKIAKYFPANPDRLSQIVHLAIRTSNYSDMQMLYEIFIQLEDRRKDLTNYIGAGMFVAGKNCLLNKQTEDALRFFDNIAVSCSEFTKFLRAIISILVKEGFRDEAKKYITRFDINQKDNEDYLISEYLLIEGHEDDGFVIKSGLELFNLNIRDIDCLKILIKAMEKAGYKEERINEFREEIKKIQIKENSNIIQ